MVSLLTKREKAAPSELVDLLGECHDRIRRFVALGHVLTTRTDASEDLVRAACDDIDRYFRVALPLHVADEEESIMPRLKGRGRAIDEVLLRMCSDHRGHSVALDTLFDALKAVRSAPRDPKIRGRLGEAVCAIDAEFRQHLALEEAVIFPAIRELLSDAERAVIIDELRNRRTAST